MRDVYMYLYIIYITLTSSKVSRCQQDPAASKLRIETVNSEFYNCHYFHEENKTRQRCSDNQSLDSQRLTVLVVGK